MATVTQQIDRNVKNGTSRCHGNGKNENFKNSYITFLDNRSEKVCMKFQPYLTRSLTGSSYWVIFAFLCKKVPKSLFFALWHPIFSQNVTKKIKYFFILTRLYLIYLIANFKHYRLKINFRIVKLSFFWYVPSPYISLIKSAHFAYTYLYWNRHRFAKNIYFCLL